MCLKEFLCEEYLQLKGEECVWALEYILYFALGTKEYTYYKHYLFMKSVLSEEDIQLLVTIREYDDFMTTYEVAEQHMVILQEEGRGKIYEMDSDIRNVVEKRR